MRYSRNHAPGFIRDFQDFVIKGNIFDLAIAVIMGGAFGKVIDSLITDIITPALLNPTIRASGAKNLEEWSPGGVRLGLFLANTISFLVISLVIFFMVRSMARFKRKEEKIETADTQECPYCLSNIPLAATKCAHCTSDLPPTISNV
jgi:large conductance mechanosensitive channel